MPACPKPVPRLIEKRERAADLAKQDRAERQKCHRRSCGWCEVREYVGALNEKALTVAIVLGSYFQRCRQPVRENHHLIGGSGRRNKNRSILAAHRLDTCKTCHTDITGHVLRPVGTIDEREAAATVRYVRLR